MSTFVTSHFGNGKCNTFRWIYFIKYQCIIWHCNDRLTVTIAHISAPICPTPRLMLQLFSDIFIIGLWTADFTANVDVEIVTPINTMTQSFSVYHGYSIIFRLHFGHIFIATAQSLPFNFGGKRWWCSLTKALAYVLAYLSSIYRRPTVGRIYCACASIDWVGITKYLQ